jgi:hypothetical protein
VIDLFQAGNLESYARDSLGIAITGKARIDEQRFARRRDNQGGRSTLDINEIDIKCLRGGLGIHRCTNYQ